MKNHLNENKLKDILDNKEFEFSEEAWSKFEAIQEEAKKEHDRKPIFILFLFLVLGGFICLYFLNDDANNKEVSPSNLSVESVKTLDHQEAKLLDQNISSDLNPATETQTKATDSTTPLINNSNNTLTKQTNSPIQSQKKLNSTRSSIRSNSSSVDNTFINEGVKKDLSSETYYSGSNTNVDKAAKSISINDSGNGKAIIAKKDNRVTGLLEPITINGLSFNRVNIWTYTLPSMRREKAIAKVDRSLKIFGSSLIGIGNKQNFHTTHTLGAEIALNNNISLATGLGYKWHNVTQLESHRGFSTKYNSFSEQFYHNSIEADKMNLIHVPLMINYRLNEKIMASLGGYYNFLFLTKGTIIGNKDGELTHNSTWIVERGINRNIVGLSLRLGYMISDNIQMVAGYEQNLTKSFSLTNGENTRLGSFSLGCNYYLKK